MNQHDWWRPENLARAEREFRECPPIDLDHQTDFGAYRMLQNGADASVSGISLHNDVSPDAKVQSIVSLLGPPFPRVVLDAGCGAGFTTRALADAYPEASVLGVDLAEDAIDFASKTQTRAKFMACSISPELGPLGEFDLIFCFEFYPFTRNTEVDFQVDFIRYFADQLRPGGRLAIYQTWTNPNSLAAIFEQVRAATPELEYHVIKTPSPRLATRLPLRLATALSILVHKTTGKDWAKPLVVVSRL
jgi:trans-aconitate methyltransferase